jgi:hypothetical protein
MTVPAQEPDGPAVPREEAPDGSVDDVDAVDPLGIASVVLSGLGFLTLLRLADRRDRTPARALALFLATSLESISGTVLGVVAVERWRGPARPGRGLLLGAPGAVLGIITTVLTFSWMRTKRRL